MMPGRIERGEGSRSIEEVEFCPTAGRGVDKAGSLERVEMELAILGSSVEFRLTDTTPGKAVRTVD